MGKAPPTIPTRCSLFILFSKKLWGRRFNKKKGGGGNPSVSQCLIQEPKPIHCVSELTIFYPRYRDPHTGYETRGKKTKGFPHGYFPIRWAPQRNNGGLFFIISRPNLSFHFFIKNDHLRSFKIFFGNHCYRFFLSKGKSIEKFFALITQGILFVVFFVRGDRGLWGFCWFFDFREGGWDLWEL